MDLNRLNVGFFQRDESKDTLLVLNEKRRESTQRGNVRFIRSLDTEPVWQLSNHGCARHPVVFFEIGDRCHLFPL